MDNTQFELRWLELQFYMACKEIRDIHNSLPDVLSFLESLQIFDPTYDPEITKLVAQEALTSLRFRPSDEELWLGCYLAGFSISYIRNKFKIYNRQIYKEVAKHKKNEIYLYPKLRPDQHEIIIKCLHILNILRRVGVVDDIK